MSNLAIVDLPPDTIGCVIDYLTVGDILRLRTICRYFRVAIKAISAKIWKPYSENEFWRHMFNLSNTLTKLTTDYSIHFGSNSYCDLAIPLTVSGKNVKGFIGFVSSDYFSKNERLLWRPNINLWLPGKYKSRNIVAHVTWFIGDVKFLGYLANFQSRSPYFAKHTEVLFTEDLNLSLGIWIDKSNKIKINIEFLNPKKFAFDIANEASISIPLWCKEHDSVDSLRTVFIGRDPPKFISNCDPNSQCEGPIANMLIFNGEFAAKIPREKSEILRMLSYHCRSCVQIPAIHKGLDAGFIDYDHLGEDTAPDSSDDNSQNDDSGEG